MATSGVVLQTLHDDGIKLLNFLRFLSHNEQDSEKIQKLYRDFIDSLRKITIANLFAKKRIICISGLQGQGKSTMIKNMYCTAGNAEKPRFKTNLARGEKFPIFITEYDQNTVQYLRWYYDLNQKPEEEVKLLKDDVTYEEFEKIASNGDTETVVLEMRVPYTYSKDDGMTGFLLLPGFEERESIYSNREENYWKQLVDFCTACANTNLFVTRANTLANGEIGSIQKKFRNLDILKNSIFLISGSETLDEKAKKEIIENCVGIFNLEKSQEKDIIFITDSPASKNDWSKNVIERISAFRKDISTIEQDENEYLKKVIYDDLVNLKYELKGVLENMAVSDLYKDNKLNNYKNLLENTWRDIQKLYSKQLKVQKDIAYNKSIEKLDRLFKNKETDWLDEIRRKIFGTNAKDLVNFKEAVASLLIDENKKSLIAQLNSNALDNATPLVVEKINHCYIIDKNCSTPDGNGNIIPDSTSNIKLNMGTCHDLAILLNKKDGELQQDNFNKTLTILMYMAFWRFQKCVPELTQEYSDKLANFALEKPKIKVKSFDEQMKNYQDGVNTSMVRAASILGLSIDAAADGKIDSIPAIAKLFGIAEGYVTAAVGFGAVAYMTSNFIKAVNRKEIEDYFHMKGILDNIYSESERALLQEAEELKNEIESTILTRLADLMGLGTGSADLINARIYYNSLDNDIRQLKDTIGRKNEIIRKV